MNLSSRSDSRQRGVALIIVLGFLVLITVLIVAYFSSVSTETSVSTTYVHGETAKFLADTAVNVVMGQIAKGTQGQLAGSSTRLTWASQPGMIRTYVDNNPSQPYGTCYKLYSAQQMEVPASQASGASVLNDMAADVPMGWNQQPAIYTDLNAPVADSSGAWNFPIVSGSSLFMSGSNVVTYRIGTGGTVEGFYINPNTVPVSNYNPTVISGTSNPVPMPVQWLYTLQDGTIISPDLNGNGRTATFKNAPKQPTSANPIVGRIAFWTDDETCKLNINTASEGTYFASPHTNSPTDMQAVGKTFGFAISPPAAGEYNRYPGHPATTCLSVALGPWLDNPSGQTAPNAYTLPTSDDAYLGLIGGTRPALSQTFTGLSAYMLLSPRNAIGGSMAGTVNESISGTSGTVTNDDDRLYASLDELMFRYPAPGDPAPSTSFPNSNLTKSVIEQMKFFLTASSRAPELTPFNTPKVSMWPQWYSQTDRTSLANYATLYSTNAGILSETDPAMMTTYGLLAFCSSFGNCPTTTAWSGRNEYFFQRYNAGNPNLKDPSPPSWELSGADWNNVPRNQSLANYLCNLGAAPIPGYGAAFVNPNKYSQRNFSDIVVESLDSIRCTGKTDYVIPAYFAGNGGSGVDALIAPLVASSNLPGVSGSSTAVKGFGFYPNSFQFVLGATLGTSSSNIVTTSTNGNGVVTTSTSTVTVTNTNIVPFLAIDTFQPSLYLNGANAGLTVNIQNPAGLGLQSVPGGPPVPNTISVGFPTGFDGSYPRSSVVRPFITNANAFMTGTNAYTFQETGTTSIVVGTQPPQPVVFSFMNAGGDVAQQITVEFPQVSIPVPTTSAVGLNYFNSVTAYSARGVECSGTGALGGDWRLLGAMYNVPVQISSMNVFGTAPNYYATSITQAHSFWTNCFSTVQSICINNNPAPAPSTSIVGPLVAPALLSSTGYMDQSAPCTPIDLAGATMANGQPGDWDTGPGLAADGPYINPVNDWADVGAGVYSGGTNYSVNLSTLNPNRLVSSPVRFGSLPTGVCQTPPQPWQTLLFCPNPAGRTTVAGDTPTQLADHFGFGNPPDHLYLEFFTMPVVQPYAISEPLSTAGKVNLNYQMAPFTYIERSTALRGVLKNTLITGISGYDVQGGDSGNQYKWSSNPSTVRYPYETRYDINRDATVAGIEEHYFSQGLLFRYPSEICDVFLVPQYLAGTTASNYNPNAAGPANLTYDNMIGWWNSKTDLSKMSFTGDNLREEPYDRLYPRLTTKSNTYTVHCRVQVLKQTASDANAGVWTEGQDQMIAEYRGSSLIERYIDPNDPSLNANWDQNTINLTEPAGGSTVAPASTSCDLSQLYKFRVLSTKKFAP